MYWSEENLRDWVGYINSIVGDDSVEGGFLVAEKTDTVEVSMAGEKEELLQRFNIPKGLYVNSVSKGSAAEKAGIVAGDIIVRVDNVIIYGMSDLQEFLSYTKAGTEVEVEVYRSNNGTYEEQILKVRLDSRPTKNQRGNSKH